MHPFSFKSVSDLILSEPELFVNAGQNIIEISKKYMSFEDIGIDFHLFIVCVSLYTFPFSSIPSIIMSSGAVLSGV